jgi:hypothetical protein
MRSYFVSDIHLSNKNKALSDAFINFLNEIKNPALNFLFLEIFLKYGLVMMMNSK